MPRLFSDRVQFDANLGVRLRSGGWQILLFAFMIVWCLIAAPQVGLANPVLLGQVATSEQQPATEPDPASVDATADSSSAHMIDVQDAYRFEEKVREMLEETETTADKIRQAIAQADLGGDGDWLTNGLVLGLVAILVGYAAGALVQRWGRLNFLSLYSQCPSVRAEKVGFLLVRALMMLFGTASNAIVSGVLILIFAQGHPPTRMTAMVMLGMFLVYRFVSLVAYNVLAPRYPDYRMVPLPDDTARGLFRSLMGVFAISAAMLAVCIWLNNLNVAEEAHKLSLMLTSLVATVLLSGVSIVYRRPIGLALTGHPANPEEVTGWRMVVLRYWFLPVVAYFMFAFAATVFRLVLDLPSAMGLVAAPLEAALVGAVFYAVLILLIDRFLLPYINTDKGVAKIKKQLLETHEKSENAAKEIPEAELEAQAQAEAIERERKREPYRHLVDHGAQILTVLAMFGWLLVDWGISISRDESFLGSLFEIFLVSFLGYMAYRAVQLAIDQKIEEESPSSAHEAGEFEVGGTGESRIATLLPIFRNFLLITIAVISSMVVLSELGVNIAPLFAGAGVVGLAVGFGAQTLIRDIFSGAFFLIDDAFRKGEYIDIGEVKGMVEKISIRSMQLRHHNGPLNTVPFGEIQFVKNFSRDWAMMKLAFRVTYDTDVEKVRKLIKKFGQELLEHPDYGPKFLQPVKSQGVISFEDSAMIVRVKFMTRPGDQFELRKVVYAGIRDIFEREGIHFAHREVKVRLSDEDAPRKLTDEEKRAVAGAVLPAIEDQEAEDQAAAAAGTR